MYINIVATRPMTSVPSPPAATQALDSLLQVVEGELSTVKVSVDDELAKATKKKKKKKKKKKNKANSSVLSHCVEIRTLKNKGRCVVAKHNIPAGTDVICERAYGYAALPSAAEECAHCRKEILCTSLVCDGGCGTIYCSEDCVQESNKIHGLECDVLPQLEDIAKRHDVDLSMLHLVLRASSLRVLESQRSNEEQTGGCSTWEDVKQTV